MPRVTAPLPEVHALHLASFRRSRRGSRVPGRAGVRIRHPSVLFRGPPGAARRGNECPGSPHRAAWSTGPPTRERWASSGSHPGRLSSSAARSIARSASPRTGIFPACCSISTPSYRAADDTSSSAKPIRLGHRRDHRRSSRVRAPRWPSSCAIPCTSCTTAGPATHRFPYSTSSMRPRDMRWNAERAARRRWAPPLWRYRTCIRNGRRRSASIARTPAPEDQRVADDLIAAVKLTGGLDVPQRQAARDMLTRLKSAGIDTVIGGCTEGCPRSKAPAMKWACSSSIRTSRSAGAALHRLGVPAGRILPAKSHSPK